MPLLYKVIKNQQIEEKRKNFEVPIINITHSYDQEDSGAVEILEDFSHIQAEAEEKAKEIIKKSLEEKSRLLLQAREDAENIKQQAYEEGYQKGYEDGKNRGYEEGYHKSFTEGESLRIQGKNVLENAHEQSRKYIEKIREEIISLAVHMAQNIISYQIDKEDMNIVRIVKKALEQLQHRKQIILRCHPQNALFLESNLYQFEKICPNIIFTILEDEGLEMNGCILESELQVLDLQISNQLENIKNALLEMRDGNGV